MRISAKAGIFCLFVAVLAKLLIYGLSKVRTDDFKIKI